MNSSRFSADFRSDTVTRPTPSMMSAMAQAELGDDVLGDDPTTQALEEKSARLFGKEAALFFPSGVMANQTAVKVWTKPGEEIIVEKKSHMFAAEAGSLGLISGVQTLTLESERGAFDAKMLQSSIKTEALHTAKTSLICLENTHNFHGGAVVSMENLCAVREVATGKNVPVHLDGARIFNAHVASGVSLKEYGSICDSLQFCLSKGLGAPVGSLLLGEKRFIDEARKVRKKLGGGMRQTGLLAACGIVALDEMIERLKEDHDLAQKISERLFGMAGIEINLEEVETNLIFFKVKHPRWSAPQIQEHLEKRGVGVIAMDSETIRVVTHKDLAEKEASHFCEVFNEIVQSK